MSFIHQGHWPLDVSPCEGPGSHVFLYSALLWVISPIRFIVKCFISLCFSSSPSVSGFSLPGTVVSGTSLACTGCSGAFRRQVADGPISSCVASVIRDQQKPADNLNVPTFSFSCSLPAFSFPHHLCAHAHAHLSVGRTFPRQGFRQTWKRTVALQDSSKEALGC